MSRDLGLLVDILVNARDACSFVAGMGKPAFQESRLHQNAVIRSLEVIGEAAGKLTPELRGAHPETPWGNMVGMRNRLIHETRLAGCDAIFSLISSLLSFQQQTWSQATGLIAFAPIFLISCPLRSD